MARQPHTLTTERRESPLGIGTLEPAFGWRLPAGQRQSAYELEVARGISFDGAADIWRSGTILGRRPFGNVYAGPPLESRTSYAWRVRVLDGDQVSDWSEPTSFETGLLGPDELGARWISAPYAGPDDRRVLYFRREFILPSRAVRARAYASALGWYKLFVNGADVVGPVLVPRWTPFEAYVEYQVYDVTENLGAGRNVLGMVVADGRYRGTLGADAEDARYGDRVAALLELDIELEDGSRVLMRSDGDWSVGTGAVRRADPMLDVEVDLGPDPLDWLEHGGSVDGSAAVEILEQPRTLIAEEVERVGEIGRLAGTVTRSPSGAQIIDFGQNFAGVVSLVLRGAPGTTVTLTHGEVLTPDGELDTDHLFVRARRRPGASFQRDTVILGERPRRYSPWFTIRGFRYVAVEGADLITDDDAEAIVLSTAMPVIADFRASDPRLDALWRNTLWSLRSNFTDTATDCPQRERSGWTGDLQVFAPTAVQLVAAGSFLQRYLRNLGVEQFDDGRIPPYIPSERASGVVKRFQELVSGSVGWGDVAVMLPWTLYEYCGDEAVIRDHYASAQKWVEHLARTARRSGLARRFGRRVGRLERFIVDSGFHWGEWLRAGEEGINTWLRSRYAPPAVVATAYFARSTALLARMAEIVGRADDAARYTALAENITQAWRAAFVREDGALIGEDKQDDYARALAFELLPESERGHAARRLAELIDKADGHLGTGFLSTALLLPALADVGRTDVAYRLLFQRTAPSWLAQIEQGATTTWEAWRGYDAEGNARDSHNHYAFGGVTRFLHEYVAGLAPAAPGYQLIRFAPMITDHLDFASLTIETPYGEASSEWRRDDGIIRLSVVVPPGATGLVEFGDTVSEVGDGRHEFTATTA